MIHVLNIPQFVYFFASLIDETSLQVFETNNGKVKLYHFSFPSHLETEYKQDNIEMFCDLSECAIPSREANLASARLVCQQPDQSPDSSCRLFRVIHWLANQQTVSLLARHLQPIRPLSAGTFV